MAEYIFPFEKLDVWQLSVDLADLVLGLLDKLPQNRHLRLIGQIEAAVTSPSQNISEGKGRQYKKEFIQYLYISRGSVFEVVTLNEIFRRRGLFQVEEASEVRKRCEQIDHNQPLMTKALTAEIRDLWDQLEAINKIQRLAKEGIQSCPFTEQVFFQGGRRCCILTRPGAAGVCSTSATPWSTPRCGRCCTSISLPLSSISMRALT